MDVILLQPGDPEIFHGANDWKDGGSLIGPESLDPNLKIGQCLELVSVTQGLGQQTTSDVSNSARTSGRPMITDLTCVKYLDEVSVRMYEYCLRSKPLGSGPDLPTRIYLCRKAEDKATSLITFELRDALITGIELQTTSNGVATERVALSFTEILWHSTRRDSDASNPVGRISSGWSIARNRPIASFTPLST